MQHVSSDRPLARVFRRTAAAVAFGALVGAAAAYAVLALVRPGAPAPLVAVAEPSGPDPLAFAPGKAAAFESTAAEGLSHVLYTRSPGGAIATARRVAVLRPQIEAAAAGSGFSPELLEAVVFLESAGRPDVIAGDDPSAAAGLAQILAQTGTSFLGMPIDLERSRALTRRLRAAEQRRDRHAIAWLTAERRRADARFDPEQALAAMVRYLTTARAILGREDLAVVSYHMGIGNLQGVLRRYASAPDGMPVRRLVERDGLSFAHVFFGSSLEERSDAWRQLAELGDDSRHYYWKVLAALEIMRLHREEPARLAALARLHEGRRSAEAVLRPPATTERFATPAELERAWKEGKLHPLPEGRETDLRLAVAAGMGSLAPELDREPSLYRGLRAEALAVLVYLARRAHALSRDETPIRVARSVRDEEYERLAGTVTGEPPAGYSLHTTGYSFDLARAWGSDRQAGAIQFLLERLSAQGVIAWARYDDHIHVTAGPRAAVLVPWLLRRED